MLASQPRVSASRLSLACLPRVSASRLSLASQPRVSASRLSLACLPRVEQKLETLRDRVSTTNLRRFAIASLQRT